MARESKFKNWHIGIGVVVLIVIGIVITQCSMRGPEAAPESNVDPALWMPEPVEFLLASHNCNHVPPPPSCGPVVPMAQLCIDACNDDCGTPSQSPLLKICDLDSVGVSCVEGSVRECCYWSCKWFWE